MVLRAAPEHRFGQVGEQRRARLDCIGPVLESQDCGPCESGDQGIGTADEVRAGVTGLPRQT